MRQELRSLRLPSNKDMQLKGKTNPKDMGK